jgi:hypothetical protein
MRKELELIEKIERYLKGMLPDTEKRAFEEQISDDAQLQEEVALQQEIMRGIERAAMKLKIQQTGARFRRGRNFTKWGLPGISAILLIGAISYYMGKSSDTQLSYKGKGLPEYNELNEKKWADADRNIAAQTFFVNGALDTVIETKGGMLLSVPAQGFLDEKGQPVNGKVELVIKEALDAASIIRAGLSSRSGDKLLESGGMFFIDARQHGKELKVNPSRGIYAQIPTDTVKPGMQLFAGKRMPDGTIDWVNPKPLEHDLIPVDIQLLNFYPPHYLDSLESWGYNAGDRRFADSLYFSFAQESYEDRTGISEHPVGFGREFVGDSTLGPSRYVHDTPLPLLCGINPAKVKTIWGKEFQNTLLSTREFEQRMFWIHRTKDNRILDLYINNLDKDLYKIDSMAAMKLSGALREQFLSFAAQKDGKVKSGTKDFNKLRDYYEKKTKAFIRAITKTEHDFWAKQYELDYIAGKKHLDHQDDSAARVSQNFTEEFDLNLKDAYRQLGYDTTNRPLFLNGAIYTVQVTNTGWCNVDRYVDESLITRTTLDYTDPTSGKKAIINYLPVSFQIEQPGEYDRLYVYLLPDKLSSFMRLDGVDGKYSEKLNELMKYKLVCVGYKGEQAFFYSQDDILPKDYLGISLSKVGNNELDRELNKTGSRDQASAMQREKTYFQFEIKDQKRQKRNQDIWELRTKFSSFLIPCYNEDYAVPSGPVRAK